MDELMAALDGLAGEDLAPLFGPALFGPVLLDRLRPLLAAQNRLAAEVTRTVRECEVSGAAEVDGLKTMGSWLRGHAHLAAAEAARVVRAGRALEHLPTLAAAFAAGHVTGEQAAIVGRVAEPEQLSRAAEQDVDLAAVDAVLTDVARERPHADVAKAVHHYLDRLDADGPQPDPTEGRRLVIARHPDGSISGRFDLDAVGGQKLQAALESIVQAGRAAGDERTRAQQQADALVQLCDNQLAAGNLPVLRGHKPHVIVTIDSEDLADPSAGSGAAEMGFGATISAARARWMACDGQVTRVVMGPDGVPLDVGGTIRLFPPHIRRAAEVRDGGCVFAGCRAPTWWCDMHHLPAWIDGGATDLANAALLCERHHTKVHHGFRVERQPDGRWRIWRPDGTEILTGPRRTGPPLVTAA
ncbi:HNH endonuclease [Geodermatophilus sp. DF01-2]|uniref:HNH endonuclease signature motif containing protein n=1 Tax=Geodermatophilus sp. DF01-2 TaxID=2559610 RepID=UPI0010741E5D|nr:HNH endonuclease signature motif containing protein [Geodermatophilus sp. DF01_2]TFV57579.1 HNH endonuclease [Geodermatophilus sp. DF01_2]